MNVKVKLLRNCDKPTEKKIIFFGWILVSRSVAIDSYQVPRAAEAWHDPRGIVRCSKKYNLALGYVQFRQIKGIKVQSFKFLNQSHSLKFLHFGTSIC